MIVYSVPHSGTHLAMFALREMGIEPIQMHADPPMLRKVYDHKGEKAIVPVRHPYKVLASHWQRNDTLRKAGPGAYVAKVISHYQMLFQTQDIFDWVPLQVDCPEQDRFGQMTRLAMHAGAPSLPQALFNIAVDWPVKGWGSHKLELPEFDVAPLDPVLEVYGYEPFDLTGYRSDPGSKDDQVFVRKGVECSPTAPQVIIRGTAEIIGPDGKVKGNPYVTEVFKVEKGKEAGA